jgi:DNA-binding NarL/FixJ family response regulator
MKKPHYGSALLMGGGGLPVREAILIVEDDPDIRALTATMLAANGYLTREAASGVEALRAAREGATTLALLEVDLPDLTGYQVYRLLRDELGERLAIIFMSGERTKSFDRIGGLLLGADDYLVKPFTEDELLMRVQSALERRHASAARAVTALLTPRELQILRLLAAGLAPREIARRLVISKKTVGAHVEHVYLKLGVQTRAQAVAVAYRGELLGLRRSAPALTL